MSQAFGIGKRFVRLGRLGAYYDRGAPQWCRLTRYRTCAEFRVWRVSFIRWRG